MVTDEDLKNRFAYHAPKDDSVKGQHEVVRNILHAVALHFNADLPESREKSLVFTHLEEAMFWANAAIARNQSE